MTDISIESLQFVIVLYKQKFSDCNSVNTLFKLYGGKNISILVYDNSPSPQEIAKSDSWEISYIHDVQNSGLGKAYNVAAKIAEKNNKKFLFLLDQDTSFPSESLEIYLDSIKQSPEVKLFSPILYIDTNLIMSPSKVHLKWGRFISSIEPGLYSFKDYVPVNSGMCIELDAFKKAGGYNENIKLDGSDFQFIERFSKIHKKFCVIDLRANQDFSLNDDNFNSVLHRYKIFLSDLHFFESHSLYDTLCYQRIKFVRTAILFKQFKKMIFLKLYFQSFFK